MPFDDTPSDESSSSSSDEPKAIRRVELARGGAILLEPGGFRLVRRRGQKRAVLHPYESMTHVYASDRMLLIGLQTGLQTIRNRDFEDPEEGPSEARRLLLARLADRPDGERCLEEMVAVDRLGERSARRSFSAFWGPGSSCVTPSSNKSVPSCPTSSHAGNIGAR